MLEFVDGKLWIKLTSPDAKKGLGDDPWAERFRRIFDNVRNYCRRGASFARVVQQVNKLQEGQPNLLDYLLDGAIQLIMNTPSGKGARTDEGKIRSAAVARGVPCITTIQAADAAVKAMEALRDEEITVQALQDRFASVASRKLPV